MTNNQDRHLARAMHAPETIDQAELPIEKTLNWYQERAQSTAHYPTEQALAYVLLGMGGEVGELQNKFKKVLRGDKPLQRDDMVAELGDVLWYVAMLAKELGVTLQEVAEKNVAKLQQRAANGTIKGDGDNR